MNSNIINLFLIFMVCLRSSYSDGNAKGSDSGENLCAQGKSQSPIALEADHCSLLLVDCLPIEFINYPPNLTLIDILADKESDWAAGKTPYVTGHLLNDEKYLYIKTHAHINFEKNNGTEHSINGKKYTIEVHFVHGNSKYGDPDEAQKHSDGVLVIGLLFKSDPNRKYDNCGFDMNSIKSFYTYTGSLTTPPCTENVRWIVSSQCSIGPECIRKLKNKLPEGELMNVRPLQPINNRTIKHYKLENYG